MAKPNGHIKIEKGIPAPGHKSHGALKYPWHEMEKGDSFVFPEGSRFGYEAARTASKRYAPKKFVTRIQPDKNFRCWRVA